MDKLRGVGYKNVLKLIKGRRVMGRKLGRLGEVGTLLDLLSCLDREEVRNKRQKDRNL